MSDKANVDIFFKDVKETAQRTYDGTQAHFSEGGLVDSTAGPKNIPASAAAMEAATSFGLKKTS